MSDPEGLDKKRSIEVLNNKEENYGSKRQKLEGDVIEMTEHHRTVKMHQDSKVYNNDESRIVEESANEENAASGNNDDKSDDISSVLKEVSHCSNELMPAKEANGVKCPNMSQMQETARTEDILANGEQGSKTNTSVLEIKKEVNKSDSNEISAIKSEQSEKENRDIKQEKPQQYQDVIMLSDDEDNLKAIGGDWVNGETTCRAPILRKIKALQNQLRNEEAVLVLLKKLRQSQITQSQEIIQQSPSSKPQPQHQQLNHHARPHSGLPPLVKGNQVNSKPIHNASQQNMKGQQMNNLSSRSQQGPPLLMSSRPGNGQSLSQQQQAHLPHGAMQLNNSRSNDGNRGLQHVQQQQQASQKQSQVPQAPPQPQDTQTPAQRQAAAKHALRKQLEKTLLQIPPPKPPPPEMNFIPSLGCPDFVLLLGLEEVVNHMIDFQLIARGQKNPDDRFVCTPFACVQCGTDFTPVWKREKPGSKNVICENCVTTNQKKALKQEHTNRLKSAFVKALQQEQEIERMQATTPTSQPPPSSSMSQNQHPSASMISAANFRPSAEQLRQHHKFYQQAQLRGGQPLGLQGFSHRNTHYPYNIPYSKQQELQRQYLLDMIPRSGMSWKQ